MCFVGSSVFFFAYFYLNFQEIEERNEHGKSPSLNAFFFSAFQCHSHILHSFSLKAGAKQNARKLTKKTKQD